MFGDITGWVGDVVGGLGYVGVVLVATAEALLPPIAGAPMPLVGLAVARGELAFVPAVAAATAGTTIGAWCWYALAALVGRERLDRVVGDHRRWLRIELGDLHRAEAWFVRHAELTVLLGRCVPVVRSLVSIPAGLVRMPWWRFTLLTVAGATLWNTAVIGLGAGLGESWSMLADWHPMVRLGAVGVGVAAATLVMVVVRRRRRRPLRATAGTDTGVRADQSATVDAAAPR